VRYPPAVSPRARLLTASWLSLSLLCALPAGAADGVSSAAAADALTDVGASPGRTDPARTALGALASHVTGLSHPDALGTAFRAYYRHLDEHGDEVRNPYLYYVDLGLDSRTPRGFVFDMERLEVVEGPFPVAHGSGSSATRDAVPTVFSNVPGSHASSLGLYLALNTYAFRGRAGGRAYESVGLRLRGESGRFNDAAEVRGIVAHGAPYVTATAAGRSEGCPAMEPERAERLLPLLANGGVVILYSPNDERWLREEPWARPAEG
jgi:hypothetical protein